MTRSLLILKNLKIQNANALSSSFTIGFPAITAWLGSVHALQRILNKNEKFQDLRFIKTGILCHEMNLQTNGKNIIGMKVNHISRDDKSKAGKELPSTIPEARCHLNVSLIIEYICDDGSIDIEKNEKEIKNAIRKLKFAGGDLLNFEDKDNDKNKDKDKDKDLITHQFDENKYCVDEFIKLRRRLELGHFIIERRDLIEQETKNGVDAVDALIDYLKITKTEIEDKSEDKDKDKEGLKNKKVVYERKTKGWLVPISTGFYALRDPTDPVEGQRDRNYKHCFVESVVTLGEFKFISEFNNLDDILWSYKYDKKNGLYVCKNFNNN